MPAAWWAQPWCSARQPEWQLPARGLDYGGDRGAPMAAIARPGICENRNRPMNKKLSTPAASVAAGKVPTPVRVRLKRVNCDQAIPYPPDGQTREWWHRLKNAFGTSSSAFSRLLTAANCSGSECLHGGLSGRL